MSSSGNILHELITHYTRDYLLKRAGDAAVRDLDDVWIVDRSPFEATYERDP